MPRLRQAVAGVRWWRRYGRSGAEGGPGGGPKHPTYKAIEELGKAVKSIFVA
ncbi:hypothetical protein ACFYUV_51145 [Nonomuraea sp. NPDC003560]|uniref:hypothetical protein n=1 Tax=Nonomuraea sp. NPDC003560 TaxID=3364341 RepID=UPI0036D10A38